MPQELKYMKKNKMKDIVKSMEARRLKPTFALKLTPTPWQQLQAFNSNLQGGKRLVQSLERNMEPVAARPQASPQASSLSQSQGRW